MYFLPRWTYPIDILGEAPPFCTQYTWQRIDIPGLPGVDTKSLRPYQALIKPLLGFLEPLAVHPWGLEFWYAAI